MDRVVAAVLYRDGGEVLLCHRTPERQWYPDVWDFPGGHVEAGEAPLEALSREIREEVGVSLCVDSLAEAPDLRIQHRDLDMSVWVVRSWSGNPVNTAPDEHDQIEWVDLREVASRKLAHPSYDAWLATLR